MKKNLLPLLFLFCLCNAYSQDTLKALPEGIVHHFNFNGNLKDDVTGKPLMKVAVEIKDSLRKISDKRATSRLTDADVEWVNDDGEKTAIRMLPMEFADDLSEKTVSQITVSVKLRINKSDVEGYLSEESGGISRAVNYITWFQMFRNHEGTLTSMDRFLGGETTSTGQVEAYRSRHKGFKPIVPTDEWVWITYTQDCNSGKAVYYFKDQFDEEAFDSAEVNRINSGEVFRMCFVSRARSIERGDISEIIIWNRVLNAEEVAKVHGIEGFDEKTVYDRYALLFNIIIGMVLFSIIIFIWKPMHFRKYTRTNGLGNNEKAEQAIDKAEKLFCKGFDYSTRYYPWPIKFLRIHSSIKSAIRSEPNNPELIDRLNSLIEDHNLCLNYHYSGKSYVVLGTILALVVQALFEWFTSNKGFSISYVIDQDIPMLLCLLAYIIVSYGWTFASQHGKPIDRDEKATARLLGWDKAMETTGNVAGAIWAIAIAIIGAFFSVLGEALSQSTQVFKVYVNGVYQGTRSFANPAGFLGPIIAFVVVLAIIAMICYFLSIIIMLAILLITPIKFIRVHILHI